MALSAVWLASKPPLFNPDGKVHKLIDDDMLSRGKLSHRFY
jgi:hypothetical protein